MENVILRLTLDLTGPDTIPRVEVQQDNARSLSISLTQGGRPYWIAEGVTAVFSGRKPDGKPLFNSCAIEKNRVVYDFTPQTSNVAGIVECEILLYSGDERILASPRFELAIDELIHRDGDVPESAPEISALTRMVAAGTAMIEDLREVLGELEGVEEILNQAREAARAASSSEAAAKNYAQTAHDAAEAAAQSAQTAGEHAASAKTEAQKASSAANAVGSAVAAAREQADRAEAAADRAEAAGNGAQGGGGVAVTPQMFGAAGDGETDDTAAIQAMFDAVGDGGLIYFPAGTYVVRHGDTKTGEDYVAVTVRGRHGLRIVLDNGATLLHKTTTVHRYTMLRFDGCDGVEISGGVIEGDRQSHQAVTTSYGSKGIHIVDSVNISVHDMEVREIFGDCIGVTGATVQCDNVLIDECTLHDSYRNGITIGGARNSTIRNCHIYGIVGADPQAGIDLEAERGIANADITIDGSYIHDCARNAIAFSSNGTGTRVRNCRLDGNTLFDNTHTGVEITGTTIAGTANFQNDVVLRGCSVTAVGCYDTTDHPGVSLTAYNTIFKGKDGIPTININGINGVATLRLVGCELNQPESSAYALIYSYNAADVDVEMDGCVVNLRNGTALYRQLAHGKYRAWAMAGCTIAVRSATMDYSFIRADADQVRISNCTIDLSGVESYQPAEIAYFWNRSSRIEFNGNVILASVPISNVLCLEGFTGTARITNNTAPMCGAVVKVVGSSGSTVVEKGNITANSAEGGGADGITPHIGANGNWYIGTTDTGVKAQGPAGAAGRGIKSIARTSGNGSAGTVDTYTITYTDGTRSTYQVRNGANGKDGKTPVKGEDYFTEADKSEMVSAVISALPKYNGEVVAV